MHRLARRLLYLALLIAVMLICGTAGFTLIEGFHPFDAFYMTLITVTTVGYREIHDLSRTGRVFNSFIIFFGVSTMFFAIGIMTQSLIELELGEFFGKRRLKRMIDKLRDHYIVCGYGRVGRGAAAELKQSGVPFVVVDRDPEKVERAMRLGLLAAQADSTSDETLREVGIERAKGLIAALATDADNLFLILSAKTLNPRLYLAARVAEDEAEDKLRRAGAHTVFAPYSSTGYRLAQAMLRPHVTQFLDFTTKSFGANVTIEQVRVADRCEFVSRSLQQMQIRRDLGVVVLAIRKADGTMQMNPSAESAVEAGDFLIVMGEPGNLRRLENLLAEPRSQN